MSELEKYLQSQDFYEDCQQYRHSLDKDGKAAMAFETLKRKIRCYQNGDEFVSEYA